MSQEKVDRYKKEKANRRQIMKKQRIMGVMRKTVLSLVALLLIAVSYTHLGAALLFVLFYGKK